METEPGIGEEAAVKMFLVLGSWFLVVHRTTLVFAVLLSSFLLHPSSFGQARKPISVGEPPADSSPAAELASFKVLDGFAVNLFADETDGIPNPIAIRWDERGRLWVLQTTAYPQPLPGEVPNDKIIILEDTDHDGRADKRTVFADGLCQPMGMELAPYSGPDVRDQKSEVSHSAPSLKPPASGNAHSVYVGEGEKLWLFHDDDGDDHVDRKEVVFSGFGTGDTHQCLNSFVWSPDGALVMHQGLHCYSKVVTPWGTKTLYGAGFWHYRPRSGKLEAYPTGMPLNPWGTVFTNDGQPIMVAGAAGMYWARPMEISTADTDVRASTESKSIPHFLLERYQLPYGGQCIKTEGLTKFCGIDLVGNTHWPESMQGEIVVGGFFDNKVFRFQLRDDPEFASGIEAVEQPALIESDSVAFRPIDIRFGPEGACYIADWYDPIIGHYQASFRHPNRDKAHGRIWRVVAKGRELTWSKPLDLVRLAASIHDQILTRTQERGRTKRLVDVGEPQLTLMNTDRWANYQGFRLIRSNRADVATAAKNLTPPEDGVDRGTPEFNQVRLMALNLQAEQEQIDFGDLLYVYECSLEAGQIGATTALGLGADHLFRGDGTDEGPFELLGRAATNDSPRVRLEAVVAAAKVQSPDAIKVALKVLDKPMDSYLERSLWLAVQATRRHWFPSVAGEVGVQASADTTPMRGARGVANTPANDPSLRTPPSPPSRASVPASTTPVSAEAYTPTSALTAFGTFVHDMPATHLAFLIKHEGSAALRDIATALLQQPDLPANVRDGLTLGLAKDEQASDLTAEETKRLKQSGNDATKLEALAASVTAKPHLRDAALARLAKVDATRAGAFVAQALDAIKSVDAMKALLAPVLPVEAATKALAQALKAKPCSPDAAKLVLRVLTSTGRNEPDLMAALGQRTAVPAYDPAWVNALAAEVKASGDATKGKVVFNSTLTNCTACHSIAKKGGTIGPELDAVGRGVPIELLIEAVTWPNRQIKEGYLATNIVTKDGRKLMGYKVSDANGELQLRDFLGGGVSTFAAADIASRTDAGSLMPEGLVALMTREELRDVIAYLTTLGK